MSVLRRALPSFEPSVAALSILSLALLSFAAAPVAVAQEEPSEAPAEAPAMSEEALAEMAAWQEAMTPGPQHERLARMAGDWEADMKIWMEPGAEPMTSTFTASRRMIFDGRFLEEDVVGEFMGQPFLGRSVIGYNNVTGKWWSTWLDNTTTGLMVGEGDWDEESDTSTFLFTSVDPVSGEEMQMKGVTRVLSADHEVHEMWEERDGESFKSMEMIYRRQ